MAFYYSSSTITDNSTATKSPVHVREASVSLTSHLQELCSDVLSGFPHKIGLFIGYHANDVAAFMGLIKLPLTCQVPWKIYENPFESLNLVEQYRYCHQKMCDILSSVTNKTLEITTPGHPFFCHTIDMNYQNHKELRQ